MATVVKYYNPDSPAGGTGDNPGTTGGGRAYNSYPELEAAEATNLVADGDIFEARRSGTAIDTVAADDLSGWNTGPSNYLRIMSDDGTRKTWSNTAGSVWVLRVTSSQHAYVRIEGFDFIQDQPTATDREVLHVNNSLSAASSEVIIDNCRISGGGSGRAGFRVESGTVKVSNSAFFDNDSRNIRDDTTSPDAIHGRYLTLQAGGNGIQAVNGNISTYINCYAGCGGTDFDSDIGTITNCASSDTSGSAGLQNIAASTSAGAYFTNLTAGSEDFHIDADNSALEDAGTDVSSDSDFAVSLDAEGNTRHATTPEIGMYESVSGGTDYERVPDAEIEFVNSTAAIQNFNRVPDSEIEFVNSTVAIQNVNRVPDSEIEFVNSTVAIQNVNRVPDCEIEFVNTTVASSNIYRLPDCEIEFVNSTVASSNIYRIPDCEIEFANTTVAEESGSFQRIPDAEIEFNNATSASVKAYRIPDAEINFSNTTTAVSGFRRVPDAELEFVNTASASQNVKRIPDCEIEFANTTVASSNIYRIPNCEIEFVNTTTTIAGFKRIPDAEIAFANTTVASAKVYRLPDAELEFVNTTVAGIAADYERIPDAEFEFVNTTIAIEDTLSNLIVGDEVDVENVILNRILVNWSDPTMPVYFQNTDYPFSDQFAKLFILRRDNTPVGISGGGYLQDRPGGIIQINVYTPVGEGTNQGLVYAEQLGQIYQHSRFNGVTCEELTIKNFPDIIDDRNVAFATIPYYWERNVLTTIAA